MDSLTQKFGIHDVFVSFGLSTSAAEQQITTIRAKYPGLAEAVGSPMYVNGMNHAKLCADLETMLQFVWLLPSSPLTVAFRRKCATDIARQLRGDISLVEQIESNHATLEQTGGLHFRAEPVPRLTEQEAQIENRKLDAHERRDRIAAERHAAEMARGEREVAARVETQHSFDLAQLDLQRQQFYFENRDGHEQQAKFKMVHTGWQIEQLRALGALTQEAVEVLAGNILYNNTTIIDRSARLSTEHVFEMATPRAGGVYVLRLNTPGENGEPCYYVGHSRCIETRVEQHTNGEGAEWVKKHGGVAEVEAPLVPREEVRAWELRETILRMIQHGCANVRGGEWVGCAPLTEDERRCIEVSAMGLFGLCRSCGQLGHLAKGCTRPRMCWLSEIRGSVPTLARVIAKAMYASQKRPRHDRVASQ